MVEAAPELSPLLERCPNLKLMVTSRELLRINGEVEYPVPPLSEPEAVELFCDRARLEPDETIAELCRRLDDLPLALELAAARTSVLSEYSSAAVDMLSELGDETGLAAALGNSGWSALCLGDPVGAADFFRRSLVFAAQVEATHNIASLALGLGAALVAGRDEQRGIEILGAAESLREELDMAFNDELEERIHEQAVADAMAALGEDGFDAAWARGRAIESHELVKLCEPGR